MVEYIIYIVSLVQQDQNVSEALIELLDHLHEVFEKEIIFLIHFVYLLLK